MTLWKDMRNDGKRQKVKLYNPIIDIPKEHNVNSVSEWATLM